ncbi:MAG: Linear gramicidin synthase subunit A [Syntrophomonadaceae bacterium]|nr:Linear gramicidin synthase subunit A [Bacillota bacterium]
MNIGLFAAAEVGCEIVKFFKENTEGLSCLILDSKDTFNAKILSNSNAQEVLCSDFLDKESAVDKLRQMQLDLIILAWWPYIVKENLIKIPRIGCLNFHPSYLPYNRGKDPNFWSIVEDVPFGVSLHFVDTGIDSGDIAFQSVIEKSWDDTGKTLHEKALKEIVKLFKDNFQQIKSGKIPRKPQDLSHGSFHRRSELDSASMIDLDRSYRARDLLNIVRARTFYPHPAAWFVDNGEKHEVRIEIKRVSKKGDAE